MTKNYILDTNVLLQDPESIFNFDEHTVIIPIGVLEELDKFKKEQGELGKNAREVCRYLDELREKGDFRVGVTLDNETDEHASGKLRVYYNGNLHSYYKETNVDLHVIYVADKLSEAEKENPCIVVSKDINVRVRAAALGFKAENYTTTMVRECIDKGFAFVKCPNDILDRLVDEQKMPIEEIGDVLVSGDYFELYPNFYLAIEHEIEVRKGKKDYVLAKVSGCGNYIEVLTPLKQGMRITPKNIEQAFVMDALMDDRIKFVSIIGSAGSGKTLLACAAGSYLTSKTDRYKKFLISRPLIQLGGKDQVGFLPGDITDKVDPYMQPVYDAFEVMNACKNKKEVVDGKAIIAKNPKIKIEVLSYIRGRSIHDQFFLIDESQNTTRLEIKTILTRIGENTKVVLTGDPDQIDCPYLDKYSNGLVTSTNLFKGSDLACRIVLSKGIRSRLSDEAAKRL